MKSSFTRIIEVNLTLDQDEAIWLKKLMETPMQGKNEEMRSKFWNALPSIEALKGGDST